MEKATAESWRRISLDVGSDAEGVTAAVAAILEQGARGRSELAAFTDEELQSLDGELEPVAAQPWLSEQSDEQKDFAIAVALRGLIARGLVVRLDADQGPDPERLMLSVPEEILALLRTRRQAEAIVLGERRTAVGTHHRYLYRHGNVAVEESINPGGLHSFAVAPLAELANDLAQWCDPESVACRDGVEQHVSLTSIAAGEDMPGPIEEARVVSVLIAVGPDFNGSGEPSQKRVSVYIGDGKLFVAETGRKSGYLTVREVSETTLKEILARLIGAAA